MVFVCKNLSPSPSLETTLKEPRDISIASTSYSILAIIGCGALPYALSWFICDHIYEWTLHIDGFSLLSFCQNCINILYAANAIVLSFALFGICHLAKFYFPMINRD